jgi:hypothetical protein
LNLVDPHLLNLGPFPGFGLMAEAVIEHAALAILAGPHDGKITVLALDPLAGQVDLGGIEAQQDAHAVALRILELVNLVFEREPEGQEFVPEKKSPHDELHIFESHRFVFGIRRLWP